MATKKIRWLFKHLCRNFSRSLMQDGKSYSTESSQFFETNLNRIIILKINIDSREVKCLENC